MNGNVHQPKNANVTGARTGSGTETVSEIANGRATPIGRPSGMVRMAALKALVVGPQEEVGDEHDEAAMRPLRVETGR